MVYDRQQAFTAIADRDGKIPLLIVQVGIEQQADHANDPVHRGSDFVGPI